MISSRLTLAATCLLLTAYGSPLTSLAATDHIARLQETYQKAKTLQAQFVQETHVAILERTEIHEGTIWLAPGQFRVAYQKPKVQSYIYNGETLWIYTPHYKEVEVYEHAAEQIGREALAFLSGLGELRQIFRIPEVKVGPGKVTFTLIPKDRASRLQKIQLMTDPQSYTLQEAILWPREGNRSHYRFSSVETGKKLDESRFHFKIPRGVSVRRPDV